MTRRSPKNTLSPDDLFDYRLAALMGFIDPALMRQSIPYRVYSGWRRYWDAEPWGPWRDNMHAAIIAREVAKSRFGATKVPSLSTFLLRDPLERLIEANEKVLGVLGTVATKMSAKEANKRLRSDRRSRKAKKSVKAVPKPAIKKPTPRSKK